MYGKPAIAPELALRVVRSGRLPPNTLHEYGGVPAVADSVALYPLPTVAGAGSRVVTVRPSDATNVLVNAVPLLAIGDVLTSNVPLSTSLYIVGFAAARVFPSTVTPDHWTVPNRGTGTDGKSETSP